MEPQETGRPFRFGCRARSGVALALGRCSHLTDGPAKAEIVTGDHDGGEYQRIRITSAGN